MCVCCDCDEAPSESHGNSDHLVIHDLERAAEVRNVSVDQVAQTIKSRVEEYSGRSRPVLTNQESDAGPG